MEGREVFVPFLGNFFQLQAEMQQGFNHQDVFVPFLGDLFQSTDYLVPQTTAPFSSPFSGIFFQFPIFQIEKRKNHGKFSTPFPGTFFQLNSEKNI